MQAAQDGHADDPAFDLNRPVNRGVFIERHMRPAGIVIIDVFSQHRMQVLFIENDHMIQAFPPKGADDPFATTILPR